MNVPETDKALPPSLPLNKIGSVFFGGCLGVT